MTEWEEFVEELRSVVAEVEERKTLEQMERRWRWGRVRWAWDRWRQRRAMKMIAPYIVPPREERPEAD